MEVLPDYLANWLIQYGSISLFFLLALGIIALPVPEETLMIFAGFLVRNDVLLAVPTFLAAFLGSVTGITVSFILGLTVGDHLVRKYGSYIWLTEAKMKKTHDWFEHYGKWMLFIGYFIPGVRHFTGVFAGTSRLNYPSFALFAYTGALFWTLLFLSIGYFFGKCCLTAFEVIEENIETSLLAALLAVVLFAVYKIYRKRT